MDEDHVAWQAVVVIYNELQVGCSLIAAVDWRVVACRVVLGIIDHKRY